MSAATEYVLIHTGTLTKISNCLNLHQNNPTNFSHTIHFMTSDSKVHTQLKLYVNLFTESFQLSAISLLQ